MPLEPKIWRVQNIDGLTSFTVSDSKPDGYPVVESVPRLPKPGEKWDATAKAFVFDPTAYTDQTTPVGHVDEAHHQKALEAILIKSGVPLTHGLLVEEATALAIPLATLADQVHAAQAAFRLREVTRREIKTGKRLP